MFLKRHGIPFVLSLGATVTLASPSRASIGVSVEGVSDYTTLCGNTSCDIDGGEEANGLQSTLRWPPAPTYSPWQGQFGDAYFDNDVWDTDLYDPGRTGNGADNDTYTDRPEVSLAGYFLHGMCDDVRDPVNPVCSRDSDCPADSYCPFFPPVSAGRSRMCIRNMRRTMVTSSTNHWHDNVIEYGQNLNNIAFGESANSGGWGQAGTDGGANIVLIMNSCGVRSKYAKAQLQNMFAGMHLLFMLMPTAAWKNNSTGLPGFSDTITKSNRGSLFATNILANLNAPAREAWLSPPLLVNAFGVVQGPDRDTGGPPSGAHVVVSFAADTASAIQRTMTETWNDSFDDTRDATSNAVGVITYMCNYDCYDIYQMPL